MIRKYSEIFCWKNVSSFCSAKATHIFSAKNFRKLYIESAKTVNEMTLNELVKLTTLWTTGPRCFIFIYSINIAFIFFSTAFYVYLCFITWVKGPYVVWKWSRSACMSMQSDNLIRAVFIDITKIPLFKYIENFTSKNWKCSDKILWFFSYFCPKYRLWVLVRTASARQF